MADAWRRLLAACCCGPGDRLRQVILYCGAMTGSIRRALDETTRRRQLQAHRLSPPLLPCPPLACAPAPAAATPPRKLLPPRCSALRSVFPPGPPSATRPPPALALLPSAIPTPP